MLQQWRQIRWQAAHLVASTLVVCKEYFMSRRCKQNPEMCHRRMRVNQRNVIPWPALKRREYLTCVLFTFPARAWP